MERLSRRDALKSGGAAIALTVLGSPRAEADLSRGPSRSPSLRDLLARGEPEIWTGPELDYIGMPVGGLFAGTVYLGGDGQLWNWDIFNAGHFGCVEREPTVYMGDRLDAGGGANYVDPKKQESPFEQRFRLVVADPSPRTVRFADVRFRGEYPIGKIQFRDADADVEMDLEAFSPFCPLDAENSSFPATTQSYTIRNVGAAALELTLLYETDNPVLIRSKKKLSGPILAGKATPTGGISFSASSDVIDSAKSAPDHGTFCVEVVGGANHGSCSSEKGTCGRSFTLAPGASHTLTFVVAWHFPNCSDKLPGHRNWYASRWLDAAAVAQDLLDRWPDLQKRTRDWNRTWYDGTLPYWLLDRTFANVSILATTTCHRLDEGRYYFWEGIGCCQGTCTHVWGYAQAIGRVFPEVERYLRKHIDFGMAYHPDSGAIDYRAEYGRSVADDGQASCVMRSLREHQMSADSGFLASIWPQVKGATEYLIRQDSDQDGILDGAQYNTLDTAWYGEIAWISSLYLGALRAAAVMALEMQDAAFAQRCTQIADRGLTKMVRDLFNGDYFVNKADPAHPEANNTRSGCHIDQVYGESWARQIGLPRLIPQPETVKALRSLFRYNFYSDVWEYRRKNHAIPGGRWYAAPRESGLIMCSFPHGGAADAVGKGSDAWAVGYFNECMSGFEYQAAGHMVAEGLVKEGLTVVRAIHDRYRPSKRNPYNEIECSDHYGRAMASYGVFIALTGFQVDGPRHTMGFQPKALGPNFRVPFINERGWGTFERSNGEPDKVEYRYELANPGSPSP